MYEHRALVFAHLLLALMRIFILTSNCSYLSLVSGAPLLPLCTLLRFPFVDVDPSWWHPARWLSVSQHLMFLYIVFRLIEGGWWTTYRWLKALRLLVSYAFASLLSPEYQSPTQDIRFWLPTLSLFPGDGLPAARPRARSPFLHPHYLTRRRLLRYKTLHWGIRPLKPGYCYRTCREILLKKLARVRIATSNVIPYPKPLPYDDVDPSLLGTCALTRHCWTLKKILRLLCLGIYVLYMFRAPIRFDDMIEFETPMSTQDGLRFDIPYNLSYTHGWSYLDDSFPDPYDLAVGMRELTGSTLHTSSRNLTLKRAFHEARQLQDRLKPSLTSLTSKAMPLRANIARITVPMSQDMHGAFITGPGGKIEVIVIDTGASISCTPYENDFVTPLQPVNVQLNGLSDTITVAGIGEVEWAIKDSLGNVGVVRTMAYYVPEGNIRLFSPQSYFREHGDNSQCKCAFTSDQLSLTTACGSTLSFQFNEGNNLPYMSLDDACLFAGFTERMRFELREGPLVDETKSILHDSNHNLSAAEKEHCLWHQRLGHMGQAWMQTLMVPPKATVGEPSQPACIPTREKATCKVATQKCAACLLARQHLRGAGTSTTVLNRDKEMAIRKDDLQPGDQVSTDQYVSAKPGRLPHTYGKEPVQEQYHGGTIFYDHATAFIFISHQISLGSGETLMSKRAFERLARSYGVTIKGYRADNHPYGSNAFRSDIDESDQTLTFSGVGAHHQNGVAERAIQTITSWARAMMMHQLLHWPSQHDQNLWPFAMQHAVFLWNHMPRQGSQLSPLELFSGVKLPPQNAALLNVRVWGCPAYVLDPRLQDKKKLPKWKKRSRIGMYLGNSPEHSSSVGQILNLSTGAVSPQFHVVYDELFTTPYGTLDDLAFDADTWRDLIRYDSQTQSYTGTTNGSQAGEPTAGPKAAARDHVSLELFRSFVDERHETPPSPPVPEGEGPVLPPISPLKPSLKPSKYSDRQETSASEGVPHPLSEGASSPTPPSTTPAPSEGVSTDWSTKVRFADELEQHAPVSSATPLPSPAKRPRRKRAKKSPPTNPHGSRTRSGALRTRTGRLVKKKQFHLASSPENYSTLLTQASVCQFIKSKHQANGQPLFRRQQYLAGGNPNSKSLDREWDNARIHGLNWAPSTLLSSVPTGSAKHIMQELLDRAPRGDWHPMALQARSKDPDTPGWEEAMNGPHADGYREAAQKEYDTLVDMKVWDVVDREDWMSVLPSTWAFRRKTFPDGTTKKLKGRFCVRGDREIAGVHYDPDKIFAPVVSWTTVRLLLLLAAQLDLATRQVDYVAAFVHSPIPMPKDYHKMTREEQRRNRTYVEMPRGFREDGKVLCLNKALYGLKSAPVAFFRHLRGNLEAIGFRQAIEVDPCLFISEKVICLVYVDDTLLYAKDPKDIDEVIERLSKERKMALEIEDDVAGFLGVDIKKDPETSVITLKQVGLKKKIIEALKIDHLPPVATPADRVLGKDENGEPPNCDFNYASVVGMCFYLYSHSCPEIGFAVSQLARFTFNPRRSHELALIRLGQYLKGTLENGMIVKPMRLDEFTMDVYVDSDFMGLYGNELRNDPDNVRSRTGYIILLNGCPIVWKSTLQDSISLSTMMAEYYALSSAMREVLPARTLIEVVARALGLDDMVKSTFRCTAHEDNQACQTLANLEPGRQTARSKFFDVKVHWFRSMLNEHITVTRVDTKSQLADAFTKPLARDDFERLRRMMVGW